MLCYDGKLSLYCFLGSSSLIYLLFFADVYFDFVPKIWGAICWGPALYFSLINIILKLVFKGFYYQIAIRATFLGYVFAMGLFIYALGAQNWRAFGIYASVMALFHYSEFLTIAYTNPKTLSVDSFILNHSPQYAIAAVMSWTEFITETYFFPGLKEHVWCWYLGLLLCLAGEGLRKAAMITARSNFNHVVQCEHIEGHELVTRGVYAYARHPSYVGWFYWSIGTQVILQNPICILAYTAASWTFFRERIYIEEITLLEFFGESYYYYQKSVPTGIPFIKGYQLQL